MDLGSYHDHCVIHVHGMHHTGTGFIRLQISESLVNSTMHENGCFESEGQHWQTVYPTFLSRMEQIQPSLSSGRKYYDLLNLFPKLNCLPHIRKLLLWQEWATNWDTSKYFWIQKSPTMDILFLEKVKLHSTVHVVTMRHPFFTHDKTVEKEGNTFFPYNTRQLIFPLIWLDVWAHVLHQLAHNQVNSFVIVQYEATLLESYPSRKLQAFIENECNGPEERHRRLELHEKGHDYSSLKQDQVDMWNVCQSDKICKDLMADLEPLMTKNFGYSWNRSHYYLGEANTNPILFSNKDPPSQELVNSLRDLSLKYIPSSPFPN